MDNTPAAMPWWRSKIILTQLVGVIFALALNYGVDLSEKIGMDEGAFVTFILTIVGVVTTIFRVTQKAAPVLTGSHAEAAKMNRAADQARTAMAQPVNQRMSAIDAPENFNAGSLAREMDRRASTVNKAKTSPKRRPIK